MFSYVNLLLLGMLGSTDSRERDMDSGMDLGTELTERMDAVCVAESGEQAGMTEAMDIYESGRCAGSDCTQKNMSIVVF